MTLALHLDRVSAGYGNGMVLRDLTLRAEAGRLTALLGPSGCGKTTVLKLIAGLLAPQSGDVWFGDERMTHVAVEQRGIAMVFQKPLLFPYMSVADNVGFGLLTRRWQAERRRAAVAQALQMVQLDGFGQRRPKELSGGQEQRVALARALITEPRVLLLDEPLSALDESLRADMRALVRDLQRRLGITTIFVTHDQREACEIADEIALLLDGRIVQAGRPRDFYTDPVSEDVARFFGWCVLDRQVTMTSGRERAVGFHPTVARLCADTSTAAELPGSFAVIVERVVDVGTELRVAIRFASGERLEVAQPRTSQDVADLFRPGAVAYLRVPPPALRFFPNDNS